MTDSDEKKRATVCERVGTNVYGRTEAFLRAVEAGDDNAARDELVALLKFFPAQ